MPARPPSGTDAHARWYDAGNQQFLAEDPLGAAGGHFNVNVYVYVYVYAAADPLNNVDPDGQAIISTTLLVSTAIYLGTQALFAAGETAVEAAVLNQFGSQEDIDGFSPLATFGKNFVINTVTGGLGGKVKAFQNAGRLGRFAIRQALEVGGDTVFDVHVNGRGVGESLLINTAGSLIGEGAARALGAAAPGTARFVGGFAEGFTSRPLGSTAGPFKDCLLPRRAEPLALVLRRGFGGRRRCLGL